MVSVKKFIYTLRKNKIKFFTGVPDSVLKNFCFYVEKYLKKKHVLATNEGSAVSIGIGHYLSTKEIPCIYMQNSGLSNAINPLISIASKNVYAIPLFLLIGWRGSPGSKDEPQHNAKGLITRNLLKLLKIKYCILKKENDLKKIEKLLKRCSKKNETVACLVEKNIFDKIKKKEFASKNIISRSEFIIKFLSKISKKSRIISTTGFTSRELMEIRNIYKLDNGKDFYMVGGMGHASSVSLGYALNSKEKIYCLDGDGSMLMHLGSLRTIGYLKLKNFKHIILNNNSHESVGGQISTAEEINFKQLIKSIGYKNYFKILSKKEISKKIIQFINSIGPSLLEVKIRIGSMNNLGRPKKLIEIKKKFINNKY